MPERRLLWPLVVYCALGVIAFARQAPPTRRARASSRRPPDHADPEAEGQSRAMYEHGSGRQAIAPWSISQRGWRDILWRTVQKINDNRLLAVAAGVVYYGLLALFPAIAAFVSLYGLVADASMIDSHLSIISGVLPGGAVDILHEEITRLAANRGAGLSFGFAVGLLFALWSANAGMKAIIDALNVANDVKEKRSLIRLNLVSLGFTLVAIVSLMLAIGVVIVTPIILGHLGLGTVADMLIRIARWPILLGLAIIGLAVLYRFAPSRKEPRWRWLTVGSVAAAVAWLISSALFSWYIANFGAYNVTYGSLGAAIGMMTWMWISMIVVLAGAQLNAEIEGQAARNSAFDR
jgi:membrane protein